jgi:hypothetical protein
MSPTRRPGALALGLRLKLVLAFYVLSAALLPLAHHDIVCHLKSATHCTTCVVGASGESAADPVVCAPFTLHDGGTAAGGPSRAPESGPLGVCSGRAPPAAA